MMKYWLFLLAVVFCLGLAVTGTAEEASSKKEKAVALFKELQQNAVGDQWIDCNNIINLLEQRGSMEDLRAAFNVLMAKEGNGDILEKVADMYFELRLNPKPKPGGVYVNVTGFIYSISVDGKKKPVDGTVYFWSQYKNILYHKIQSTASLGYAIRIWGGKRYDCQAKSGGKSSDWKEDYLPGFPEVLNFRILNY